MPLAQRAGARRGEGVHPARPGIDEAETARKGGVPCESDAWGWRCLRAALAGVGRVAAQDKEGAAEAKALLRQVLALQKAGKVEEAAKVQEKLVEKVKQVFGATHVNTGAQLNRLAGLYR